MTLRITLLVALLLAFPQVSSAMSYAFPYTVQAQPIYFDAISLTGCPYPTGYSVPTSTSYPTGVSYDTSDSYPTGYSYPTGSSYPVGYAVPTGSSAGPVGTSYATGVSAGPVGASYAIGVSYPTGYSMATGSSVPTGYSAPTSHPKGTKYGAPNYAQYAYPNYYNETPTYMQDYTGYMYQSYYPQYANQYGQTAGANGYNYINTAHYVMDPVTGAYYISY